MQKKLRISRRAVGDSGEGPEIRQSTFYTVCLADGFAIGTDPATFPRIEILLGQIGLSPGNLDLPKMCGWATRKQEVVGCDLGDRKMFIVPRAESDEHARTLAESLLDHAQIERITALSDIRYACHNGPLPLSQIHSVLQCMRQFDATDGPYRLWFEVPEAHFPAVSGL